MQSSLLEPNEPTAASAFVRPCCHIHKIKVIRAYIFVLIVHISRHSVGNIHNIALQLWFRFKGAHRCCKCCATVCSSIRSQTGIFYGTWPDGALRSAQGESRCTCGFTSSVAHLLLAKTIKKVKM